MLRCPDCTRPRTATLAWCGSCGRRFEDVPEPPELERTVSILTSDLQGSTALGDRLDPESLREVLDQYIEAMRLVIEAHGGTLRLECPPSGGTLAVITLPAR